MNFSNNIMELRYSWDIGNRKETWEEITNRVVTSVFSTTSVPNKNEIIKELIEIISQRKFIPGGRFLAQAGRGFHQTNNCFCLRAQDTRESWGDLLYKAAVMLMSGGGVGVDYTKIRASNMPLRRSGGVSSGPLPLMRIVNEVGRGIMAGGKRRSAIWAGLNWKHPDIENFITCKNWLPEVRKIKEKDFDFPASMDMTNISVILDKNFFKAYNDENHSDNQLAKKIYWTTVERMLKTGEPGFSINYKNSKESLRNACTEIVSEDDSDVCCLGSINLSKIETIDELKRITMLGQLFLMVGVLYSDCPTEKVREIREKNMRTGLGLMGIHAWLIQRNYKYDVNDELAKWLKVWQDESNSSAESWANTLSVNEPVAKRAIAPNGTTAIAGRITTGGIEPIYSIAYQRRYLTSDGWKKQFVVDFVAEEMYQKGVDPGGIEDAYTLSRDVKRRIRFQSFVQKYVDNAIASTINLPTYGTLGNNDITTFGDSLMEFLPNLRGITCYPDGSRGGQPLVPVEFSDAIKRKDVVFEANEECSGGACGV